MNTILPLLNKTMIIIITIVRTEQNNSQNITSASNVAEPLWHSYTAFSAHLSKEYFNVPLHLTEYKNHGHLQHTITWPWEKINPSRVPASAQASLPLRSTDGRNVTSFLMPSLSIVLSSLPLHCLCSQARCTVVSSIYIFLQYFTPFLRPIVQFSTIWLPFASPFTSLFIIEWQYLLPNLLLRSLYLPQALPAYYQGLFCNFLFDHWHHFRTLLLVSLLWIAKLSVV